MLFSDSMLRLVDPRAHCLNSRRTNLGIYACVVRFMLHLIQLILIYRFAWAMFRGLSVSSRLDGHDGSSRHAIRTFASCTHIPCYTVLNMKASLLDRKTIQKSSNHYSFSLWLKTLLQADEVIYWLGIVSRTCMNWHSTLVMKMTHIMDIHFGTSVITDTHMGF